MTIGFSRVPCRAAAATPGSTLARGMAVVLAGQGVVEGDAPALERLAGCAGLVAKVVAVAHEGVDGAHGVALVAGEKEEGVVKVLGAVAGYGSAVCVGLV